MTKHLLVLTRLAPALLGGALLLASGCAHSLEKQRAREFGQADLDRDGRVSYDEFARFNNTAIFQQLDRNHDGGIAAKEWGKCDRSTASADNFKRLDKNGDGRIDLQEYLEVGGSHRQMKESFHDLDRNLDDYLSVQEFQAWDGVELLSIYF